VLLEVKAELEGLCGGPRHPGGACQSVRRGQQQQQRQDAAQATRDCAAQKDVATGVQRRGSGGRRGGDDVAHGEVATGG
jgi:hypothetical protein